MYYGPDRVRDATQLCSSDIVITTYGTLGAEAAEVKGPGAKKGVLHGVYWWRIVLDEAHQIKGRNNQVRTARARASWARVRVQ